MLANLRLGTEIGSGSFGKVCRAEWNGQPVAVKTLHEHLFNRHDRLGHVDNFEKECKILQGLEHRNVVRLLEFVISHSSPPMLITELLDYDIVHFIGQHHPNKIPLPETVSIALDVAQGLIYLHHECEKSLGRIPKTPMTPEKGIRECLLERFNIAVKRADTRVKYRIGS